MSKQYRTSAYERIARDVTEQFDVHSEAAQRNPRWRATMKRWLTRVGLTRLIARDAIWEAHGLLRSINANTYRANDELHALLIEARDAVNALAVAEHHDAWARFSRGDRSA
jgi:hypothetical protein